MSDAARWYVIHTYSGYENKVATNIEKAVENRQIEDLIQEVRVPTETVTEIKDNKKKEVERKIFPGSVLVKMVMTDDSWYVVRNIRGVTGFVGPGSKPVPLTEEEVDRLGVETRHIEVNFEVGDSVQVIDGYLDGFVGRVDAIVDAGECSVGVESTVISLAENPPVLLRPGAITPQQLRKFLPDLVVHHAVTDKLQANERADSPGMKYKHYAPKAQITILDADSEQFVRYVNAHAREGLYALCFEEDVAGLQVPCISLGADERTQAKHLFAALRELDERGAKEVYARCPSREGVGLAVYNRLIRAAAYHECDLNGEKETRSNE